MPKPSDLDDYLSGASVHESVFALRPDYRALLICVDGLEPTPSDADSEARLHAAEVAAQSALAAEPVDQIGHVSAWREAYRSFGAKPQRTRNSLEALLRRSGTGLPRVNRLTDIYNAVSVHHQIPVGGEDLHEYTGPPRLQVATGSETFDTVADGAPITEHPDPGEVVWCDDDGVTCRRWNWRQAQRTRLRDDTTAVLFILDALDPISDADLAAAGDALVEPLRSTSPDLRTARRLIRASGVHDAS